jgi:hypothetical protein
MANTRLSKEICTQIRKYASEHNYGDTIGFATVVSAEKDSEAALDYVGRLFNMKDDSGTNPENDGKDGSNVARESETSMSINGDLIANEDSTSFHTLLDSNPVINNTCMYNTNATNLSTHECNKNATESATIEANGNSKTQQMPLSQKIEDWIKSTSGWFDTPELDRDLGINSTSDKNNRREIMLRLESKGIVERHAKISKQFRYVNTKVTSLAFKTASTTGVLPVKWPLGIEKYVNLFPGNMAVVAGSPNAGKTALLLNFIYLNQGQFPIYYFCSEMGAVELRDRLDKFPGMAIEDWKFEAVERASEFADVIRPDCINVIDYLEMTTELYLINTHLTAISHKLGSGLAIVAVQKKQGAQYGRGQEFGMEKPKLYLSMDKGKMQIVKGKSWATKNVNPNGLQVGFKIIDGCQFQKSGEWDWVK